MKNDKILRKFDFIHNTFDFFRNEKIGGIVGRKFFYIDYCSEDY